MVRDIKIDPAAVPFKLAPQLVAQVPRVTFNDVMDANEARLALTNIFHDYDTEGLPVETDEQKQMVLQGILAHLMLNSSSPYQQWTTKFEANGRLYPTSVVGKNLREDARRFGRVYCDLAIAMVEENSDLRSALANRWNVPVAYAHIGHDLVPDSFELTSADKDFYAMLKNKRIADSSRSDVVPVPGINKPVAIPYSTGKSVARPPVRQGTSSNVIAYTD